MLVQQVNLKVKLDYTCESQNDVVFIIFDAYFVLYDTYATYNIHAHFFINRCLNFSKILRKFVKAKPAFYLLYIQQDFVKISGQILQFTINFDKLQNVSEQTQDNKQEK